MNRALLCRTCGEPSWSVPLSPEDMAQGWTLRHSYVATTGVPQGHGVTIGDTFHPISELHCDLCNDVMTGSIVIARTMWRREHEPTPADWELDFGTILTPEAVALADTLSD